MPGCSGAIKRQGLCPGKHKPSSFRPSQDLPGAGASAPGVSTGTACPANSVSPKVQLQVLQVCDLKPSHNSSTALSSNSSLGTEFATSSCSCARRTPHSSPTSAPQAATALSVPHLFSSSTGELASLQSVSLQAPGTPTHPLVACAGSCPGPARSRNTFAQEQHHQPPWEAPSSVSAASLGHRVSQTAPDPLGT